MINHVYLNVHTAAQFLGDFSSFYLFIPVFGAMCGDPSLLPELSKAAKPSSLLN